MKRPRKDLIIICLFYILSSSFLNAQLLRPSYSRCPDIDFPSEFVIFKLLTGDKEPSSFSLTIDNESNYEIIDIPEGQMPEWCFASKIEGDVITFTPRSASVETEEMADIYILASINPDCVDTIQHVRLVYSAREFKKLRFLTRLEAGALLSNVNHSIKSIYGSENYNVGYYTGFLAGLDLIEVSAPEILSGLKLNLGAAFRYSGLEGKVGNASSGVSSTYDLSARLGAELPLSFISPAFKRISGTGYLTLPWMSWSAIADDGSLAGDINDESTLNISYGIGLRYYLNDAFCIGARFVVNEFQSNNSQMESGSKISYDLFRSELTFSIVNFYDKIYDLIKY